MHRVLAAILACLVLAQALPAEQAQQDEPAQNAQRAVGDWHGELSTPAGQITVVVRIEADEDGRLTGTLESVDQAPGRRISLDGVAVEGGTLRFAIPAASARFEGRLEDGAWRGTFVQGIELPLTLRPGLPEANPIVPGLDGVWRGTITRNGVDLRLVLHIITTESAGTVVRLDSPDQGAVGIPVAGLRRQGDTVRLRVPAAQATYDARLHAPDELTGTWTTPTQPEASVTFTRDAEDAPAPQRARPQHPEPPYPYRAIEVAFDNPKADGVRLAATLTLPEGEGPFPAAVLITGSGPQDRDQTLFGHKPFLVLADHLTRSGVAVLRYDDRGVGGSSGDFASATTADFASDASAAVAYLRTRADVGPVGLIGHSEGGLVAPMAAATPPWEGGPDYLVLLAAPGTDMVRLLVAQNRLLAISQGASAEDVERRAPVLERLMRAVADAPDEQSARRAVESLLTADALRALEATEAQRPFVAASLARPWMRQLLATDPADHLRPVRVPVLALNGSLDRQVPADANLPAIEAALTRAPEVFTLELEGLNHLFQPAATGGIGEYQDIETTFDPGALEAIGGWITARFGSAK